MGARSKRWSFRRSSLGILLSRETLRSRKVHLMKKKVTKKYSNKTKRYICDVRQVLCRWLRHCESQPSLLPPPRHKHTTTHIHTRSTQLVFAFFSPVFRSILHSSAVSTRCKPLRLTAQPFYILLFRCSIHLLLTCQQLLVTAFIFIIFITSLFSLENLIFSVWCKSTTFEIQWKQMSNLLNTITQSVIKKRHCHPTCQNGATWW